jgi:hypothetical protein
MMTFKQYADHEWFTFAVDNYVVHVLFAKSDGGPLFGPTLRSATAMELTRRL